MFKIKKQILFTIFSYSVVLLLSSCGGDDVVMQVPRPNIPPRLPAAATVPKEEKPQRYVYKGGTFRDPFIALTAKRTSASGSKELYIPSIDSLELKGILDDGTQQMAILEGGGVSFIIKENKLYDANRRLIKGITGVVKKNYVVMRDANKRTKEIKLKKEN